MAVTITTKFYESSTPAWHTLSKVVFTSPFMDSPNVAGIRSHILPGETDLALWYEDSSNMYRIENSQNLISTSYADGLPLTTLSDFDSGVDSYINVSGTNCVYEDIKALCGIPLDYVVSVNTVISGVTITADDSLSTADRIFNTSTTDGWEVFATSSNWYIEFPNNRRFSKVNFKVSGISTTGTAVISARTITTDAWSLLGNVGLTSSIGPYSITFCNELLYSQGYKYYKLNINDPSSGFEVSNLSFFNYQDSTSSGTAIPLIWPENSNNGLYIQDVLLPEFFSDDPSTCGYDYKLDVFDTLVSGTISSGTNIYYFGYTGTPDFNFYDSIVFEVTHGECYDCKLTAWDDSSHSTTNNVIIAGNYCRVSAVPFFYDTSISSSTGTLISGPTMNKILKGNSSYFGIFDMKYRYTSSLYGDFIVFKPVIYGLTSAVPYGIHDFLITLHYSYT